MRLSRAIKCILLVLLPVIAVLVLCSSVASVAAQCAMCKASLAGSNNASFIRYFNLGVLVLLVPPVTMFCSIFIVLRRHRTRDEEEQLDNRDNEFPR